MVALTKNPSLPLCGNHYATAPPNNPPEFQLDIQRHTPIPRILISFFINHVLLNSVTKNCLSYGKDDKNH